MNSDVHMIFIQMFLAVYETLTSLLNLYYIKGGHNTILYLYTYTYIVIKLPALQALVFQIILGV